MHDQISSVLKVRFIEFDFDSYILHTHTILTSGGRWSDKSKSDKNSLSSIHTPCLTFPLQTV